MSLNQHLSNKPIPTSPPTHAAVDSITTCPCFDCNICLDIADEPVVTLCGHLYCWPCIYKWFFYQSASLAPDEPPQCPVCKAQISHTSLVPIYGPSNVMSGDQSTPRNESREAFYGLDIPPRPSAEYGTHALTSFSTMNSDIQQQMSYRNPYQNHPQFLRGYDDGDQDQEFSGTLFSNNNASPLVCVFGETVCSIGYGNSDSSNMNQNPYRVVSVSSPTLRRQQMLADLFLSRFAAFLLCAFLFACSFSDCILSFFL